jgi:hypothetical protein
LTLVIVVTHSGSTYNAVVFSANTSSTHSIKQNAIWLAAYLTSLYGTENKHFVPKELIESAIHSDLHWLARLFAQVTSTIVRTGRIFVVPTRIR